MLLLRIRIIIDLIMIMIRMIITTTHITSTICIIT